MIEPCSTTTGCDCLGDCDALLFQGVPLSPTRRADLAAIGINEDWINGEMTDNDAEVILAFHKFLNSGEWGLTEEGERIFITDQASYDYATGKIDSKEYLDGD